MIGRSSSLLDFVNRYVIQTRTSLKNADYERPFPSL